MTTDNKKHWENIYAQVAPTDFSWYQQNAFQTLHFITTLGLNKNARIIDIGGGDSALTDKLLEMGYLNLTILDISMQALKRSWRRIGQNAGYIHWIEADIADFTPPQKYDLWHDRAAFHFLTDEESIHNYMKTLSKSTIAGSIIIMEVFAEDGPDKCSGLPVQKYSVSALFDLLSKYMDIERVAESKYIHMTPQGVEQPFSLIVGRKK